jgi:transcriptional regulator with XRE-family HTH domain
MDGYNKNQRKIKLQKSFGRRLRELRLKEGLSQEALAFKCGIHRNYLGSVERGERNIALRNIDAIARALGITLSEFFDFEINTQTEKVTNKVGQKDNSELSELDSHYL